MKTKYVVLVVILIAVVIYLWYPSNELFASDGGALIQLATSSTNPYYAYPYVVGYPWRYGFQGYGGYYGFPGFRYPYYRGYNNRWGYPTGYGWNRWFRWW